MRKLKKAAMRKLKIIAKVLAISLPLVVVWLYMSAPQTVDIDMLWQNASQGDVRAQYKLGVKYATGKGVAKDNREAVRWFRLAANQSDAESQISLGWMYFQGRGVPKDEREAYIWVSLAAMNGAERATQILDRLANWVSPTEHQAVQAEAKQRWQAINARHATTSQPSPSPP